MSQILKSFLGLFLILTMVVTSAGILSSYLSVLTAQNTHAAMIDELENSCFYPEVIRECFAQAEDMGYKLSMTLYGEDGSSYSLNAASELPDDIADINMARVELEFGYFFSNINLQSRSTLCGYAR